MPIRKKKKDEDEDSFASKLSTLGDALSTGGEEEAESTLESLATITKGVADIHSAWSARTEKNREKAGLENTTEGGNPMGKAFENEYKIGSEAFTEDFQSSVEDSKLFNNAVKGQLDLDDPKNQVIAKAFGANKNTLDKHEGMSFTKMMKMDPDELKKLQMPWGGR